MSRDAEIHDAIARLLAERAPDGSVSPDEVARAIAGTDPKAWSRLMPAIRRVAIGLADAGTISIRRKGKPADPHDFKGVYRLGPPAA